VCATSKQSPSTKILSSYPSLRRGRDLFNVTTIWQAARATSAATSYFESIKIGGEEFIDGATPANNPIFHLWDEADQTFGDATDSSWDLEERISCILSIGTGEKAPRPFGDNPVEIGRSVMRMAMDPDEKAREFERSRPRLLQSGSYFRFNVEKGLEKVGLHDIAKQDAIIVSTRAYLEQRETYKDVVTCARVLADRDCKCLRH
jgi:predicted acylesterase/phospholipase RssA